MSFSATGREWATRGVIAVGALVLAYWAFDYSAAINIRRSNPELAYRMRPADPGAVAAAMNDRLIVRGEFRVSADDAANVRIALQKDPLNRVLLRTMGIRSEITKRPQAAFDAMSLADRASRRDSVTQLWLAEYARRQQDPVREVAHYDAAMLVNPETQKLLFPKMIPELARPEFRNAIRPYILRRSRWTGSFVGTAASADLEHLDLLVTPVIGNMVDGDFNIGFTAMIQRFASRGQRERAVNMAKTVYPDLDSRQFSNLAVTDTSLDRRLGSLAWTFQQTGEISSTVDDAKRISIAVLPLATGPVATRDVMVRPGTGYRFSHRLEYASGSEKAQLRWTAGCVSEQRITGIWQGTVPQTDGPSTFADRIDIPADCHVLRLAANVVGPESQIPAEFAISQFKLTPERLRQNAVSADE